MTEQERIISSFINWTAKIAIDVNIPYDDIQQVILEFLNNMEE